ncbi:HepT-like ribonuclease domain-containing protein [Kamptonema formosum]|uniref:HepT-like ribonuclease domain-containing protein n=1 Tax=Kamptonema formosum TaxID=331992 RepID=UPI00034B4CD2|nr:HepT-like ribonuclease domain-containing protein [Oscillatoria sp. PCC 10802]
MSQDSQTLLHFAKAARLLLEFKQGIDKTAFLNDVKKQSAILYQFVILGEAVKRLSQEFRHRHPDIPWSSIAEMGDKLIYNYDWVNLDRVWDIAEEDIPNFLAAIEPLLRAQEA